MWQGMLSTGKFNARLGCEADILFGPVALGSLSSPAVLSAPRSPCGTSTTPLSPSAATRFGGRGPCNLRIPSTALAGQTILPFAEQKEPTPMTERAAGPECGPCATLVRARLQGWYADIKPHVCATRVRY